MVTTITLRCTHVTKDCENHMFKAGHSYSGIVHTSGAQKTIEVTDSLGHQRIISQDPKKFLVKNSADLSGFAYFKSEEEMVELDVKINKHLDAIKSTGKTRIYKSEFDSLMQSMVTSVLKEKGVDFEVFFLGNDMTITSHLQLA